MMEQQETLIQQLQHPDRNVRSQAALALGKQADVNTLDDLLHALGTEPEIMVREDITWAVVRIGADAVSPLMHLLKDANPVVRHNAAHTLGKIADPRAVDALIETLADSEVNVVQKAAFALSQIGDAKAIPALIDLLSSDHREVQATLDTVLEQFGAPAVQALIQALEHERWQVREHAADALGFIAASEALAPLIHALRDEHWQVRFSAVAALGYLGGTEARDAIQSLHNDPEEWVRGLVPQVLKRMKMRRR